MINLSLKFSKTKTIVLKTKWVDIQTRFYPGPNGLKKTGEEIAKKCIGIGCESTRPFFTPMNNNSNTISSASVNTSKAKTTETTNTPTNISTNSPEIKQPSKIDMVKPMYSIKEKFKYTMSETNKENSKFIDTPIEKKESSNIQEAIQTPLVKNSNFAGIEKIQQSHVKESFVDSSNVVDDFVGIPFVPQAIISVPIAMPPPLPKKIIVSVADPHAKTFQEEFFDAFNNHENRASSIQQQLQELKKQNLVNIQEDNIKIKAEFYAFLEKNPESFVEISTDKIAVNNLVFNVGMLEVTQMQETEFLSGVQNHVIVWVYVEYQDSKIVLGFLTSDKTASVKLSDQQPFNFEQNKPKEQRYVPLKTLLLVTKEEHIKSLSPIQLEDGIVVDQQKIGTDYVNTTEVSSILLKEVKKKLVDSKFALEQYEGVGITAEDIDEVLKKVNLQRTMEIDKNFKSYIKIRNLQNNAKIENWFINKKNTLDKNTFDGLQQRIEEYENKFK